MGSSIDKLVDSLHASLEEKDKRKPKAYDTTAEVTKVDEEEGIAWVHFPNGVSETPVRMTTNARVGDNVIVRVSGRKGWLLGNSTNPPTDDFVANIAHDRANKAYEKSDDALRDAERANEASVCHCRQYCIEFCFDTALCSGRCGVGFNMDKRAWYL